MYAQCAQTSWNETNTDDAAQWLVHKTKLRLLHERLAKRVEAQYGAQLDALADAILAHAQATNQEASAAEKQREALTQAYDKVFDS